jgi:hypothetical protein
MPLAAVRFRKSPISYLQSHMSRQYTLQHAPVSTPVHIEYAAELNEQQLAAVTAPPGSTSRYLPAKPAIEPTALLICVRARHL